MKALIKQLFAKWTCLHRWELRHTTETYATPDATLPVSIRRLYICEKCGKMREIVT